MTLTCGLGGRNREYWIEKLKSFLFPTFQPTCFRLLEATYTQTEVTQILHNLKQLVTLDIENELINVSHINCLLLKQLFSQAEKWYLYLNIDISEIQNKHLLDIVRSLDDASAPNDSSVNLMTALKPTKLQPLEQISVEKISAVLKTEIEKLK
ncbi:leucine zipper transcription factor-like protein 1, partial [Diaphorina citri]|uniref:Leucine zipper transcription factor-like protein 1 n=1 Tax=Diaphorina citri TaxID=121845 RepID=A0A3Q0IV72_DIACI